MYQAPTSPYEAAWQQWNYGGGATRGEPMPRIEDYPDMFEEDPGSAQMFTDMSGAGEYGGGFDRPGQRIEQMQPDYATAAPSPASPYEVYGTYAPQPAQPGMGSNVMGGAMGNAMGRPGMANALLGGAMGSAIKKNPGLLKRAAGGPMGAMTLGQLNRRKGY